MLHSKHMWRVLLFLNSTFCRFENTCFIIHEYQYLICLIDFTESLFSQIWIFCRAKILH